MCHKNLLKYNKTFRHHKTSSLNWLAGWLLGWLYVIKMDFYDLTCANKHEGKQYSLLLPQHECVQASSGDDKSLVG